VAAKVEAAEYGLLLAAMSASARRLAGIVLGGCGTVQALLEGAAALVGATPIDPVVHPDADDVPGGFLHRLPVRYRTIEGGKAVWKGGAPGTPPSGLPYLELEENPLTPGQTPDAARVHKQVWKITRTGMFDVRPTIVVTGVPGGRTVRPLVLNETLHEGVGYLGTLAEGEALEFRPDGTAWKGTADVTKDCWWVEGAMHDDLDGGYGDPDEYGAVLRFCRSCPAGALDRGFRAGDEEGPKALKRMTLPLGTSTWRVSVEEGLYGATRFDGSVWDPTGLEVARVQLKWLEHKPFAVVVRLPRDLRPILADGEVADGVARGLERIRAAGVELKVEYAPPGP
jgi:hypothetical protein